MRVEIRPATSADEAAVLDLIEEMFVPPGWRPPSYTREHGAAAFRDAVARRDSDVLLALDAGDVVGMASVYVELPTIRFGRCCWLEDLVVTASRRSQGIGRLLLDAASAWGSAHGCDQLGLSSAAARRDAHRFYLANGMTQSGHFTRPI